MPSDLKEALGSARKPDLTHVRRVIMNYIARACEYGNAKYERGNFLRPVTGAYDGTPKPKDFERLTQYLRATLSHVTLALDAMELHRSLDHALQDPEGMKRAAFAPDTDEPPPSYGVGASRLPHLAHAAASLMMALAQAALCGLLPDDPGVTWITRAISTPARVDLAPSPVAAPKHHVMLAGPQCHVWRDGVRCQNEDLHQGEHNFGARCQSSLDSTHQCHLQAGHAGLCYFGSPL